MQHKVPFVLASTVHGSIILARNDYRQMSPTSTEMGVGIDLLVHGEFDLPLISMTCGALELRRRSHGEGVVALDCGANIGIYSIEWARAMLGWGAVVAFEPQERIYYALAGNLALNNLFNVRALNLAVGAKPETVDMPVPDYQQPAQFGGLKLRGGSIIGQDLKAANRVQVVAIDGLGLERVDFIKLDIEGMEVEALEGARKTIERDRPYMLIEWIHAGLSKVTGFLDSVGYEHAAIGMNLMAGPAGNEMVPRVRGMMQQHQANLAQQANGGTA